jgi:hypothetical protein
MDLIKYRTSPPLRVPSSVAYGVHTSLLELPTRLFDPPTPLKRGQMSLKVPLKKGDLGGSTTILILYRDVCTP